MMRSMARLRAAALRRPQTFSRAQNIAFARCCSTTSVDSDTVDTVASTSTAASQGDLHSTLQELGQNFHDNATLLATSVEAAEPGWFPTDFARLLIESIHTYAGLEWWAAIAVSTVAVRTMLFPVTVKLMQNTSKLTLCKPEIAKIMARQNAEKANNPNYDKVKGMMEINEVYEKYGTHPIWTFGLMLTQMPIFVSIFLGLRRMEDYYPDICTGGAFWFPDLAMADPLHYLPVMASATFMTTILVGDASMGETNQGKNMKRFMLGMGLLTVPISWNFPAAVLCYWVANNTFSIVQTGLLNRVPAIKPMLGILPPPTEAEKIEESTSQFAGITSDSMGKHWSVGGMPGLAGMPALSVNTATDTTTAKESEEAKEEAQVEAKEEVEAKVEGEGEVEGEVETPETAAVKKPKVRRPKFRKKNKKRRRK